MPRSSRSTTKSTLVNPSTIEVAEEEVAEFKIIKVSPGTHKELQNIGTKGETFDDVIKRLIKEHTERQGKQT